MSETRSWSAVRGPGPRIPRRRGGSLGRALGAALLLLPALLAAGCAAVVAASAAGVGYVQYQRNELARDFRQGAEETWKAGLQAMEQIGYGTPASDELGPTEAEAEFTAGEESIRLRAEARPEGGTRLLVRVGRFESRNHRRKALLILDEASRILDTDEELRAWSERVSELEGSGE